MRRIAVLALALSPLFTTGAAASGTPDVAMLIDGTSGRTLSIRSREPLFDRLRELLDPTYTGTVPVPSSWDEGHHPPVRLTVVWGRSGVGGWPQDDLPPSGAVTVEQTDQVILADDGTPWIRRDVAPEFEDADVRWHPAPRSAYERWEREGVFPGATPSTPGSDSGWWVVPGVVGVVLGAGGVLLVRRAAARRDAGPPREEPRQELIEL
ncbi:hypothetical protein PV682_24155 [Streptomyces niveiscabiei]|uniref:hypothetical protein n=1 Tax=Streptomyces niveiscabiei TaxID=164115 RepID=UPI0029B5F792|nr:hypothetical protein [Streptomyces niveiscabiei]MDX3384534.1 hypothetical protein [Streptomyces niveiscabiei]